MMKRNTCEECGGNVSRKKVEFQLYGEILGSYMADVCGKCGEEVFDEEVSLQIESEAKKRGLWGLSATTKIAQMGSSVGLTINKKIADFMQLEKGEQVRVHPENKKRLIIEIV